MPRFVTQRAGGATRAGPAELEGGGRVEALLKVPADPSSLSIVRHAVGGIGTALGLGAGDTADLRLALTEAVSTAIRRCDRSTDATIEVRAEYDGDALRVTVSDHGHPLPIGGELPLPLVAAVTDAVELTHTPGGGTAVTLTFRVGGRVADSER